MENKLEVINEQEVLGKQFRIYGTAETPLFLAKDVAEWIEHSDVSMMMKRVDEDEKLTQTLFVSGQNREMWFLTEDGLYEVLMQSRKPIAKQFKKKVKGILKEIRKTGQYVAKLMDSYMIADPIERAKAWIKEEEHRIALAAEVKKLEPKAKFADAVSSSPTSVPVGDLAKMMKQNGIDIGQNKLFAWLRKNGWLMKDRESWNLPMQKGMNMGYFEIKEMPCTDQLGYVHVYKKPVVTGKGQIYFLNKMLSAA